MHKQIHKQASISYSPESLSAYHLQRSLSDQFENARLPDYVGLAKHVVDTLRLRLNRSEPIDIEVIAHDLAMTSRTLQRRLVSQGLEFDLIRDQVRRFYALHMMVQDDMSSTELRRKLDFSDDSQFMQAFVSWTGVTPSVFQRLFLSSIRL